MKNILIFLHRLRGSYMALDGGKLSDALVDFTGGLGERVELQNRAEIPHNLYDLLWKSSQMNSMIGGSIYVRLFVLCTEF